MSKTYRTFDFFAGAVLLFIAVESSAEDWPQWRGPNRDGVSKDTGLLKEWPKAGPKLLWHAKDLGGGYATPAVKIVKVSAKQGQPAIQPSIETTLNKSYPIARPMFMYTPGSPPSHVQKYLDWILSDTGQKLVETSGYVPLPKK